MLRTYQCEQLSIVKFWNCKGNQVLCLKPSLAAAADNRHVESTFKFVMEVSFTLRDIIQVKIENSNIRLCNIDWVEDDSQPVFSLNQGGFERSHPFCFLNAP